MADLLPWAQEYNSPDFVMQAGESGYVPTFQRWMLGGGSTFGVAPTTNYFTIKRSGVYSVFIDVAWNGYQVSGSVTQSNTYMFDFDLSPTPSPTYIYGNPTVDGPDTYGTKVAGQNGFNYFNTSMTSTLIIPQETTNIGTGIAVRPKFANGTATIAKCTFTVTIVRLGDVSSLTANS